MNTQTQGKQPATGKIWHNADSLAEAEQWKVDLLAKGAIHVELKPETDRSIVSVIITLDRSRANEILGYEVAEEEWLDVSDDEQGKVVVNTDGTVTIAGYTFRKDALFGGIEVFGAYNIYQDGQATDDLDWMVPKQDTVVYALAKDALLPNPCNVPEGGEQRTTVDEQRTSARAIDAAYVAVEAHASRLDIEGDHESKVRELLISLHEYCGIYAVDLVREFAEVRRLIDSGEIASPEWRKWNGPAAQPREMAGCLAMTDETWGNKTPADGGSTESSNGLILVPSDDRTLAEKPIKTVFCIARTGDVGGVDWFATQDGRVAAERFDGDVLFDLDVEIGLSPSEITRAADNMANNEMWLEEGSGCRRVTESGELSESPEVTTLFEAMVKKALEEAKGLRVVFSTMLQNPDDVFREHSGQEAELIGVGIDPKQEDWDEEAMPFLKVRFADGVEIEAFGEELFSKDTRFFKLYSTVVYGYCAARTLQSDYVGPYHLAAEGADVDKQAFLDALSNLPELTQCDQAPWTPEAFRVDAQKAA